MSANQTDTPVTALAVVEASPLALPAITLQQARARRQQMVQFVRDEMTPERDFGTIPGTDKPTLLKPGAEKLCTFFGLRPIPVIVDKLEDWEAGFFYYLYRYELYKGDTLIAAADGSANSKEKKYRWRNVPEFKATDDEKQRAVKRDKKTSKNGKAYTMLTVENDDPYTLVNTLQKMAQKRALIAATLIGVNASEFFTQDMEDMAEAVEGEYTEVDTPPSNGKAHAQPEPIPPLQHAPARWNDDPLRLAAFAKKVQEAGVPAADALKGLGVNDVADYQGTAQQAWAIVQAIAKKQARRPLTEAEIAELNRYMVSLGGGTAYVPDALEVEHSMDEWLDGLEAAKAKVKRFVEGDGPDEAQPELVAAQ